MIMDRPTGVFINYLTVCCQSLSIKKMIELTQEELKQYFSEPIFGHIAETADALGLECYVVGGYVRDIFLQRPSKDIDVVVVGSGIAMAEALGKRLGRGAYVSVFKNFGTAQVKYRYGSRICRCPQRILSTGFTEAHRGRRNTGGRSEPP